MKELLVLLHPLTVLQFYQANGAVMNVALLFCIGEGKVGERERDFIFKN